MHDRMHGESKKGRLVRREASRYKEWDASADILIGPGRDSRPMRGGKVLGTAVLWGVLSVAIALLAPNAALAEAVQVDARSAHRAVWKVYGAGKSGTAFAIGDHHFLTCAHVIKDFSDHGATEVFINQHGSKESRTLRVNYGHVALTLVHDIALFTTKETVDHYFTLAQGDAMEGDTGLRAMGYPLGLQMETLRQTDPITFQDEFQLTVSADKVTRGGLSGAPLFADDGKVVGMHCQGSDNVQIAVKVEHPRRFLDGDLAWTACGDYPSVAACIEQATTQARELAEAGDRLAQYQLGRDDGYLDKDLAMLRRAAEGGFASAQFSMGMRMKERDQWAEAAGWFSRSAGQGDPLSRYQLGLAHYRGRGVTRDRMRAFELIYHAARSGYVIAEYGVGLMYERGAGTMRDLAKARRWLQRAADKGDEDAREKLKSLPTDSPGDSIETGTVMRAVKRSNVRDGPGKSYAKVDILEVGEAVRVIERTGNWFKQQPKRGQPERFVFGPLLSETGRSTVEQ